MIKSLCWDRKGWLHFFNFFLDRSRASVQVDLHNRLRKCGIIGAVTLNNLPSLGHHQERQPFLDLNDIRGIYFFGHIFIKPTKQSKRKSKCILVSDRKLVIFYLLSFGLFARARRRQMPTILFLEKNFKNASLRFF